MHYVYLIRSKKDNSVYVGYSKDLRSRFKAHNSGKVRSTKPLRPYELLYYEAYINRESALNREKKIKQHRKTKEELLTRINTAPSSSG